MSAESEVRLIPDIQLYEEVLPGSLYERLVRAVRAVGKQRLKQNYTTTFWFPLGGTAKNVAEEAIVELIKLVNPPPSCTGVEWWLGRLPYGKKLRLHFDRDMTIQKKTGKYVVPIYGSVLYLNSFPSSPTVILNQTPSADGKSLVPEEPSFKRAIDAVSNRYVVFPGNLLHGVIPENVDTPAPSSEMRLTLLVNYWVERPQPPICFDYDGEIFAELQHADVFSRQEQRPRLGIV